MVKRARVITVICMVLAAFLLFGCDGGGITDTLKEMEVDLTNLDTDVDVVIEIVDSVTAEVLVTVAGIPGEVNVVTFVDPGTKTVEVNVEVFEWVSTDVLVTEETTTVDVNVDTLCKVVVDADTVYAEGFTFDLSLDCGDLLPVNVDVDVDVPWGNWKERLDSWINQ